MVGQEETTVLKYWVLKLERKAQNKRPKKPHLRSLEGPYTWGRGSERSLTSCSVKNCNEAELYDCLIFLRSVQLHGKNCDSSSSQNWWLAGGIVEELHRE